MASSSGGNTGAATGGQSETTSSGGSGGTESSSGGTGGSTSSGGAGGASTGSGGGEGGATGGSASGGTSTASGGASTSSGGTGGNANAPLPPELTWTQETTQGVIEDIWGSSANDIYAVGRSGRLVYSNGDDNWTSQSAGTSANLTGVWGSGPDNIFVSADSNAIRHSLGTGDWTSIVLDSGLTFRGIWGFAANDIYVVGPGAVHYNGTTWDLQEITDSAPVLAIWGSSSTDIYVGTGVASSGRHIYHSEGDGSWQAQGSMMQDSVNAVWGSDANHVYAGEGRNVLFSSGDGQWSVQLTTPEEIALVMAGWSASATEVYACTQGGTFYRSNGQGLWSEAQIIDPEQTLHTCSAMWGTGPDNIYLGTNRGIYHGTPAE